jgi:hypothetical protein
MACALPAGPPPVVERRSSSTDAMATLAEQQGEADAPCLSVVFQSSFTGLTFDRHTRTWRVRVNCRSKQHHVGR